MKTQNQTKTLKTQYLSYKNEGHEFYAETLPKEWDFSRGMKEGWKRLQALKAAMPAATLQVTLEQEMTDKTYNVFDCANG